MNPTLESKYTKINTAIENIKNNKLITKKQQIH